MARTGIVKDKRYLDHQMGSYHPESPQRLEAIYAMLEQPDMAGKFYEVPVREARKEELLFVHSPHYVGQLEQTRGIPFTYLDPDTQTCAESYDAALLAAGGLCEAISLVAAGKLDNAFALVRPPGHHAERNRAMGFCLFNNIAVGAKFAQKALKLYRILIVDWDLHHGNGTQHTFDDDPSVLYFSTHQYPYYPGTGAMQESGRGTGEGFTVNVPLRVGCGDGEYIGILEKILKPIALDFNPDLILVSAGFDTYEGDPLGGMEVTLDGYAGMTHVILDIARACCGGKVVLTLEGGYNVEGERDSVKRVLKELAGLSGTDVRRLAAKADEVFLNEMIERVRKVHHRFWKDL
ncbi:MAG: histone deacetylase [Deltaproteobacteria bacterium]|nr:histone deacetylase [Deltaproteobacteria bacterium]